MKTNEVKTVVAILIPDKTDFKTKAVTTDKEEPCNSTSGYLSEETQNTKLNRHMLYIVTVGLFTITKIKKWCIYTTKHDSA